MQIPTVESPDVASAAAATARQGTLTKPPGALGRLEELSIWVSSRQGICPPTQFERARVVVFAGDDGVARSGVSAFPPEVTAQMVANIDSGGAAINVLAGVAGATVRVVDVSVDAEPLSEPIGGFLAQAAVRRTPVLLDGVVVTAAALVAERLAPGARAWWQAGHRSTEPAHTLALAQLELVPIIDLGMRLGEGTGAAMALPIVRAAIATLAEMATFESAAVSGRE